MSFALSRTGPVLVLLFAIPFTGRAADPVRWRSDYNAARKEAADSGRPICLQISSDNCIYCRKMEASTLIDPGVTGLLGGQYIPVKIDGTREQGLIKALRIQMYPTTVLAGADGSIHAVLQGYVTAEEFRGQLKKAADASAADEKLYREVADATTASKLGDYAKAIATAQRVVLIGKGRPAEGKANELIEDIEKTAADKLASTAALKDVSPADMQAAVAGVIRTFPGTRAASRAEAQLAAAGGVGPAGIPRRAILTAARQLAEKGEYAEAMDLLGFLSRGPAVEPETAAAGELLKTLAADPEKLAVAARQAAEKAAAFQLALSETWAAKGNPTAATACLEQVLKLCPTGPKAEAAQAQLTKLRGGGVSAVPVNRQK